MKTSDDEHLVTVHQIKQPIGKCFTRARRTVFITVGNCSGLRQAGGLRGGNPVATSARNRVHIEGGLPLKEWFERLQHDHAQSEAFSFMPLDAILVWSGLTSGKPLFRSLVIFENDPVNDGTDRYKDLMGMGDIGARGPPRSIGRSRLTSSSTAHRCDGPSPETGV